MHRLDTIGAQLRSEATAASSVLGLGPRITSVEAVSFCAVHRPATNTVLCKITTDAGITGWGEGSLELKEGSVATCIEELGPHLLGEDARRVEFLFQKLYEGSFWKGGQVVMSALSSIEQALWDIKGKSLGVPAHELMGGRCRDKIRIYGHFGFQGHSAAELAQDALKSVERGLTCLKTGLPMGKYAQHDTAAAGDMAERMRVVREAVGDKVEIAIDMHGRLNPASALQMIEAVAPFRPFWIEEPCPPENLKVMHSLVAASPVPIATGERLFTLAAFNDLLNGGDRPLSIVQPDICHAGGLSGLRKIAALAEANYCQMAPHNPNGAVSTAASFQLGAAIPNLLVQEFTTLGEDFLRDPFVMGSDGYVTVPSSRPGLGFEIDEEKLWAMPPPTSAAERRLYGDEEGVTPQYDGSIRRG